MSGARRIQRKRGRGWRLPDGAVFVGRPSAWGNWYRVSRSSTYHGLPGSWFVLDENGTAYHPAEDTQRAARQLAVELFTTAIADGRSAHLTEARVRDSLAGRDLVCWCPLTEPCHADVLLAVANGTGGGPLADPAAAASRVAPRRLRGPRSTAEQSWRHQSTRPG